MALKIIKNMIPLITIFQKKKTVEDLVLKEYVVFQDGQ